ncbi:MAG: Crp/Fnr family transcriptional regulator [Thiotrichaceae bacterium]
MNLITKNLPCCKDCHIRKSALFGELETKHLDKARSLRTSQMKYSVGEYLYHEGDKPSKTFTVYEGWVALFKILEDGSRQIITFSLPGDLLCYKANKNSILDHSAVAISDVTLCAFPTDGFRNTIAELPELAFAISSINELVMERCHATLTTIASHSAETKVAYLLLTLYLRQSSTNDYTDGYIPFPVTQEDIGDALGLTAIHVNRVYQGLRKQGLIECKNKSLKVLDRDKMASIAKVNITELKQLMFVI